MVHASHGAVADGAAAGLSCSVRVLPAYDYNICNGPITISYNHSLKTKYPILHVLALAVCLTDFFPVCMKRMQVASSQLGIRQVIFPSWTMLVVQEGAAIK